MPEKSARPARRRATKTNPQSTPAQQVQHAEIAERAYFIYLDQGRSDELENWLQAERELLAA